MKLLVIFVTAFSILQARSTKSKYKSSNRMKTSVHRGGNDFMPQHPLYVSHVGENNSKEGKAGFMGSSMRPSPKSGCFWQVVNCRQKVKTNSWNEINCVDDKEIMHCCDFECREKDRMERKAKQTALKSAKQQAMATFNELQSLEKQREMIMNKLHTAQDNVLQIFQPEASAEDLKNLGQVPESPEEELGTLVNVANAVLTSEIDMDPKIKAALEQKILNHIVEVADEIKDDDKEDFEEKFNELIDLKYPDNNAKTSRVVVDAYEQNSVKRLHKGDPFKNMAIEALNLVKPELAEKLLKKTDSEEAEDFVDENDILINDDPFSNFLKDEMGLGNSISEDKIVIEDN